MSLRHFVQVIASQDPISDDDKQLADGLDALSAGAEPPAEVEPPAKPKRNAKGKAKKVTDGNGKEVGVKKASKTRKLTMGQIDELFGVDADEKETVEPMKVSPTGLLIQQYIGRAQYSGHIPPPPILSLAYHANSYIKPLYIYVK